MSLLTLFLFFVGLGLLIVGAESLVRGASRLAAALGISPLVVGLTVVAFGTSSPEVVVSLQAGLTGQPDIVIGAVVGSNIANVLLILGLSAIVAPLIIGQRLVRLDVPLMIGASLLLLVLALDGTIDRADSLVLLSGGMAYTVFVIRQGRRETKRLRGENDVEVASRMPVSGRQLAFRVGQVVVGLALLIAGARWLVDGAVAAARALGLSELIVGLTVVAVGTSLPEFATSIVASLRGESDIAVGNVVGSNLFNILAVLGLAGFMVPGGLPVAIGALDFDIPFMVAVAVACLPIFFTGYAIARWEGWLFLIYYAAYTLYLFLAAAEHDALPASSPVLFEFVVPITAVTLGVLVARAIRSARIGPITSTSDGEKL